jgi:hypothetical protein
VTSSTQTAPPVAHTAATGGAINPGEPTYAAAPDEASASPVLAAPAPASSRPDGAGALNPSPAHPRPRGAGEGCTTSTAPLIGGGAVLGQACAGLADGTQPAGGAGGEARPPATRAEASRLNAAAARSARDAAYRQRVETYRLLTRVDGVTRKAACRRLGVNARTGDRYEQTITGLTGEGRRAQRVAIYQQFRDALPTRAAAARAARVSYGRATIWDLEAASPVLTGGTR